MSIRPEPAGLYVHVPFCRRRCEYCNFAIVVAQDRRQQQFCARLLQQARFWRRQADCPRFDTMHLGGGTPSRLSVESLTTLIGGLRELFELGPAAELAIETNPEDIDDRFAERLAQLGVNRVTIGVQSLSTDGLRSIGREGTLEQASRAIETTRAAGIRSVAIDLIFGRPGQTLLEWRDELESCLTWPIDHLSAYALEFDEPTPLSLAVARGRVRRPSSDLAAAMYELTLRLCPSAGFAPYEISNFAKPGHASRHNLKYWSDLAYLGLGPSAASYLGGMRWTQPRALERWLELDDHDPESLDREPFDPDRRAGEAMIFGLRSTRGIDLAELAARYGSEPIAKREAALTAGVRDKLATQRGAIVALTERGRLLADELFVHLL
jgi:oxygen-independent coproporphyrinogen-3 oxidase